MDVIDGKIMDKGKSIHLLLSSLQQYISLGLGYEACVLINLNKMYVCFQLFELLSWLKAAIELTKHTYGKHQGCFEHFRKLKIHYAYCCDLYNTEISIWMLI